MSPLVAGFLLRATEPLCPLAGATPTERQCVHASATEGISLVSAAAGLWWRRLPQLVLLFATAFGLHLLGLNLSVRLGPAHQIAATVVFVLAVLAQVGALVIMLWLCRPAEDEETALDVAALAIGPFLAVYALSGLVDDEVYALFAANIAVSGLGGTDEWSVNLLWLGFYVVLAMVAWCFGSSSGWPSRRRPPALLLLGVVLEGTWTFASALALLAGWGRVLDWVTSRTVLAGDCPAPGTPSSTCCPTSGCRST